MPRSMSFALTKPQIRKRTKTVTRRLGWENLKPGEQVWAVEKAQGLKKGEKQVRLCLIECVRNQPGPLYMISEADCTREGFPDMTPEQFITMFCNANRCEQNQIVNRIEFKYVEAE